MGRRIFGSWGGGGGCTKHDSFKRPAAQAYVYNSLWRLKENGAVALAWAAKEELLSSAERERKLVETSAALSTPCLSTSVPHSLGTCLETGIYTTVSCGSRAPLRQEENEK